MSYCDPCKNKHDKNPIFKDHRVLDKSVEKSDNMFCKVHKGEQVKFLCRFCQTVICTFCVMNQHEGHDVVELASFYKNHQEDIRNMQHTVEAKLAKLREKGTELEKLRHLNLKSCQQAENAIKERTIQIMETAKEQEGQLLDELRKRKDEKLSKLNQELDSVNFFVAKSFSLQEFASSTVQKNSLKMMAVHEELLQRMKTVIEIDTTMPDQNVQSIITFLPSRNELKLGRIDDVQGTASELENHNAVVVCHPRKRSSGAGIARSLSTTRPKLLFSVNKLGSGLGEIRDPLGVACLLNGDVVVTEWGNKRVQIFDSVGKPVSVIAQGKIGPQGVAITLKGNIMITDAQNKRLEVFTPSGSTISKWGLGKFYGPCGIAISPNGNCVVSDIAEHTVSIYQGEKRCIKRFGSRGTRNDQLDNPLYLTTAPNSDIIVSDSDNHCLKIFDSMGNFKRRIGSEGSREGQLRFPRGVCMDDDGNIIVADRNNERVCLFTPEGHFIRNILTKEDGLHDPYAVAVTSARNLVLTESAANRASVKLFQLWWNIWLELW